MTLIDIVSSRRKAEILKLLFGMDQREFHLRELARKSGLALGTIQQELARLAKVGLVTSRKDGNRLYYRANQGNPVFGDLRNIVFKTDGLVNVLLGAVSDPDIEVAFLFGSLVSATAKSESDVDLMVIGAIGLRRLARLLSGLSEKVGREINPHVMTRREFFGRMQSGDPFVSSVMSGPRLFLKGSEHELAELGE